MKRLVRLGRGASMVAVAMFLAHPQLAALAQTPAPPVNRPPVKGPADRDIEPIRTVDVALDRDRGFSGQVVDVAGRPVANATVLLHNGRQQWQAVTDADGRYRMADVRGGAYLVRVGDQLKQVRVWAPGTAPPAANRGLMMVHGDQLIRGQAYCGSPVGCGSPVAAGFAGMREALSHPLVIGGIVAAAIAIPVAIHNSDDDPAPAS